MASTDCLQLNKSSMFAKIRAGLPIGRSHTQNLLECKDDLLFCWNAQENYLLVLNWRAALGKGFDKVQYQTLIPSVPLSFEVERLLVSNEGSLIALAGLRGVCVVELPRRWGANGQFMEGKAKITCRASNLDGHFFTNNPHLVLRQLRWHPASPTDSHLLVLFSDNTIRVYDNVALRHVWQVGPVPLKTDGNPNSSTAYALGEAAVDFDIAPAVNVAEMQTNINNTLSSGAVVQEHQSLMNTTRPSKISSTTGETNKEALPKSEKIEWPIVILRENGNIYVLMSGLDTERPRLQGPITITPATADNYGVDSCSILVIPSLPPTLVIAETNGKLHHALFLETESAEDSFNEVDDSLVIHPSEWTVHVLETVELELGLPKEEVHQPYYCPIYLKRDIINELRYFAYHNTGLHVISVNFIAELERFLENEVNSDINTLLIPSNAEYIICTKIDSSENVNAVLGFVLMQMPSCSVLLLGSGQVISLKLVIDSKLLNDYITRPKEDCVQNSADDLQQTQLNQVLGPSFIDHIKNILKRSVTQPILSLDKSANPSPQECYELLIQAVEVLRSQYLKRHELVRSEFARRINTIKLCREQQKQEIEDLERQRELIRDKAHKLAERFEEISDQQEVLTKRCQDLMRQANTCLPSNTLAEKEFAQEVERVNKLTKNMHSSLQKSKETINKQMYHISKYQENTKKRTFELPETQERTIKEILLQMTAEIDSQIKEVKRFNKIVGI